MEKNPIELLNLGRIEIGKKFVNCENYIGTFYTNTLKIYEFNQNYDMTLINSFSTDTFIKDIDFNNKYKNIILTCCLNDHIKLYKISNQDNNEIISILEGNSTYLEQARFNPVFENLVVSSDGKIIELWDITKYLNLKTVSSKENIINLKWDIRGNFYAYIYDINGIIIGNMENNNIFRIVDKTIKNYEFKNNKELITFHTNDSLKIWDIRKCSNPINIIENFPVEFELYNKNNNYKYLKDNYLKIYNLDNFKIEFEEISKKFNLQKDSIILNDYFPNQNKTINIFEQDYNGNINIIKIINNKFNESQQEIKCDNKNNLDNYLSNIKYWISNTTKFAKYIDKDEGSDEEKDLNYPIKNYIFIPELKEEMELIKYQPLKERKKYVEKEMEDYNKNKNKFNNIFDEYLYYIKLLIRDNTNKNLLEKYLRKISCLFRKK